MPHHPSHDGHHQGLDARYVNDLDIVLRTLTAERAGELGRPGTRLETWVLLAETVDDDGDRRFVFLPQDARRATHLAGLVDQGQRLLDNALDVLASEAAEEWWS